MEGESNTSAEIHCCKWQFCDFQTSDASELVKHIDEHIEGAIPIRRSRVYNTTAGESYFPSLPSNT